MKKGIVLYSFYKAKWMGGIYYIKSVAMQLCHNENITNSFNIFIMTDMESKSYYENLDESIKVITIKRSRLSNAFIIYYVLKNNIKYRFPSNKDVTFLSLKSAWWIPDFQDSYFPKYFTQEELEYRKTLYENVSNNNIPLVLSSEACLSDFDKFYPNTKKGKYVMHFVSYIDDIIRDMTKEFEENTLNKFGIKDVKYACAMNQFWQHKNHKVVFEAIQILARRAEDNDCIFVMTGLMEDHRSPEYIEKLKKVAEDPTVSKHVKLLGLIDRKEQLAIMKNAEFVIQPSLFEGWGTVLEDAKVLDKTVLLSDIPVHREQMNEKCILFDPNNPEKLADLIVEEFKKPHQDDVEKGIEDMKRRAKEYSKGFEQMLKDLEYSI